MGEREVPTELVRHILSFLNDDPAVWVRTTSGVCQVWRAVSHDLLRHHAARTLSLLPPTLPHPSYTAREKPAGEEPTGEVLYAWRHTFSENEAEEDEWFEYYTQLVAISRADAAINQPRTRHTKYYSGCPKREKLASGQVWTRQPWANVFERFTAHGCSSLSSGPLASMIRLLLLASESPVALTDARRGGHPFVTTDYVDLKLFVTIRASAQAWLPWSPPAQPFSSRTLCLHLRDEMHL